MILGLIQPTAGKVEFQGRVLSDHRDEAIRSIGAIIETPAFYPYLSGRDNLRGLAIAAGGVPDRRIDELIDMVGLADRAKSPYKTYSLGMKQRLGIASTLLTDPKLVILDEPTNGLDPAGQREVRDLIPRLAHEGRGVLLASHLLNEVEQVCDRVAIIRRGKLLQFGPVGELLQRGAFIEITLAPEMLEPAAAVLRELPFVGRVTIDDGRLQVVTHQEHGAALNQALAAAGFFASAIIPRQSRLEDVFLEMTSGDRETETGGEFNAADAA
jgi:ABC-2 type transport system ATP-binding protein